jgi:hypothetical protein
MLIVLRPSPFRLNSQDWDFLEKRIKVFISNLDKIDRKYSFLTSLPFPSRSTRNASAGTFFIKLRESAHYGLGANFNHIPSTDGFPKLDAKHSKPIDDTNSRFP